VEVVSTEGQVRNPSSVSEHQGVSRHASLPDPLRIDGPVMPGDHDLVMTEEAPGGTVGCDVCGVLLAADKVEAHRAWHRTEEERCERLTRSVEELLDRVRGAGT
jgi:hypothetical protein